MVTTRRLMMVCCLAAMGCHTAESHTAESQSRVDAPPQKTDADTRTEKPKLRKQPPAVDEPALDPSSFEAPAEVTATESDADSNVRSHTRTLSRPADKVDVPDPRSRASGDDWPRLLGPTGDSKSREKGILTRWQDGSPRIVWQRETGDGYGMPAISRGRLFHFEQVGNQPRLDCLNSETGNRIWQFKYTNDYVDLLGYESGPRASPVVDDDRVYLYGVEGMLHCLRVTDGKLLWRVDTVADYGVVQNFFGVGGTPVVEGDLLIAMVGGSPPGSPNMYSGRVKGNNSGIVAFNKYTGQVRYKITSELAGYSSPVLATIGGRQWCFLFMRGGLVGFEPSGGKVDFHYPWRSPKLESVNASNPVVVGDRVFISECYGPGSSLLAVRPGGYDVVWKDDPRQRHRAMQTHWNTPIHHQGYLYGSSGRNTPEAELRCIELATGKVTWSQPNLTRSSLLMVDGHFVCLSEEGTLRLLKVNPEKYDPVAELVLTRKEDPQRARLRVELGLEPPRLLKYPAWAAPILSHGLLYVRGDDRLVCLELIPPAK